MYSKAGVVNLCLALLYSAINNYEDIDNDYFLSNAKYLVEAETGITIEEIKRCIKPKKLNPEEVAFKAASMTLRELADAYDVKYDTIRNFCIRNNIKFQYERPSDESLVKELMSLEGKYTISQMARITKHHLYKVKECVLKNNIPYKESVNAS